MIDVVKSIFASKTLRKKIFFTLIILAVYRFFVVIPVPFADIFALMGDRQWVDAQWLDFFAMLLGGTLEQFSIIALWLIPFINASIIMQLLTVAIPHLEELQEQWEVGQMKTQQYTRRLTVPLAFAQSIGMVFFINMILWGNIIDTWDKWILFGSAFVLVVWTVLLMWIWELITEKGISNGVSLIIFSSIIAGMSGKVFSFINTWEWSADLTSILIFMILIVLVLVVLSIMLVKTKKEVPIIYARQGKIEETAILPIPLNPVGMIPIIFSMAFVSFPYVISQMLYQVKVTPATTALKEFSDTYLNMYTQNPSWTVVLLYFILIVLFTFFYTWVVFKPEKMAENIQKRGGFIQGIRPGKETAMYLNGLLKHLCFWWGTWLWIIWIYTYVLNWIPFIQAQITNGWLDAIPVIITGSGIIIVVWVVQELINKVNAELLMEKYDKVS